MSIDMKYVDEGIGVMYEGRGMMTGQEIIDADRNQLSNLEMLKKKKHFLGDFSNIEDVNCSNEEIEKIVELDSKMFSITGMNLVVIVANKDIMFGTSRIWQTFVDRIDWKTHVCREMAEAETWLKTNMKTIFNLDITIK